MENVFDVLVERGYLKQFTHEEVMREILGKEKVTSISDLTQQLTAYMLDTL